MKTAHEFWYAMPIGAIQGIAAIEARDAEHRAELLKLQDDLLAAANREVALEATIEQLGKDAAVLAGGLDRAVELLRTVATDSSVGMDRWDEACDTFLADHDSFFATPPPAESRCTASAGSCNSPKSCGEAGSCIDARMREVVAPAESMPVKQRPTYNHSRGDSPLTPCPHCASRTQAHAELNNDWFCSVGCMGLVRDDIAQGRCLGCGFIPEDFTQDPPMSAPTKNSAPNVDAAPPPAKSTPVQADMVTELGKLLGSVGARVYINRSPKGCVCPFPRDKCPLCTEPCEECRKAAPPDDIRERLDEYIHDSRETYAETRRELDDASEWMKKAEERLAALEAKGEPGAHACDCQEEYCQLRSGLPLTAAHPVHCKGAKP